MRVPLPRAACNVTGRLPGLQSVCRRDCHYCGSSRSDVSLVRKTRRGICRCSVHLGAILVSLWSVGTRVWNLRDRRSGGYSYAGRCVDASERTLASLVRGVEVRRAPAGIGRRKTIGDQLAMTLAYDAAYPREISMADATG